MADPTEQFADQHDALSPVVNVFEQSRARMVASSGNDSSGQVTVRTTADGGLEDVIVAGRWITVLEPETLPGAILEAYQNATMAGLQEWGRTVAEADLAAEPRRPLPPTSDSVFARMSETVDADRLAQQSPEALDAMAALLEEINGELDAVTEEATALAEQVWEGESRGARVSVSGAGVVSGVECDPDWARQTNGTGIGQHVMKAYRDALRQARSRTVDDLIAGSRLGELQRLAQDPEALATRLRLH
jgi:DNA-binding protein YbaB